MRERGSSERTPSRGGGSGGAYSSPGGGVVAHPKRPTHQEGLIGGVLLHSPNGAAWWGMTAIVFVAVCGDLDFLSTNYVRIGLQAHR